MKHFYYLLETILILSLAACSSDESIDKGNNTTECLIVSTYNMGDFTGSDISGPSIKDAYDEVIKSINADILATQEDTPDFYGSPVGETLFPNSNYYRTGDSKYNYKSFVSNYAIENVRQIMFNAGTYITHNYFLCGELKI